MWHECPPAMCSTMRNHSTYRLFRGQDFPANHLAMVLTNTTYNTQVKHKKSQTTKPINTKLTLVLSPLTRSGQKMDKVSSNKKHSPRSLHWVLRSANNRCINAVSSHEFWLQCRQCAVAVPYWSSARSCHQTPVNQLECTRRGSTLHTLQSHTLPQCHTSSTQARQQHSLLNLLGSVSWWRPYFLHCYVSQCQCWLKMPLKFIPHIKAR